MKIILIVLIVLSQYHLTIQKNMLFVVLLFLMLFRIDSLGEAEFLGDSLARD
jgi:hypothetical protein